MAGAQRPSWKSDHRLGRLKARADIAPSRTWGVTKESATLHFNSTLIAPGPHSGKRCCQVPRPRHLEAPETDIAPYNIWEVTNGSAPPHPHSTVVAPGYRSTIRCIPRFGIRVRPPPGGGLAKAGRLRRCSHCQGRNILCRGRWRWGSHWWSFEMTGTRHRWRSLYGSPSLVWCFRQRFLWHLTQGHTLPRRLIHGRGRTCACVTTDSRPCWQREQHLEPATHRERYMKKTYGTHTDGQYG